MNDMKKISAESVGPTSGKAVKKTGILWALGKLFAHREPKPAPRVACQTSFGGRHRHRPKATHG